MADPLFTTHPLWLGVVHDANNGLHAARFALESLLELLQETTYPTPDRLEMLTETAGDLEVATQRVGQILRDHLTVSRPTAVDLRVVLQQVVDHVARAYPEVEITDRASRSADLRVKVFGGESGLRRIVDNLVRNAVEGDGKRGATKIELMGWRVGPRVCMTVEDNGPGFPMGWKFGVSSKENGLGLGLATVKSLLEASDGDLLLRYSPGRGNRTGTRITVELPCAKFGTAEEA